MDKEKQLDNIRGCMIGGTIGDALGYAVEFLGEKDIFQKYGEKGITSFDVDSITGKALISDDTQMSLFTSTGLLHAETRAMTSGLAMDPYNHVYKAYLDWLYTQENIYQKDIFDKIYQMGFGYGGVSWLLGVPELYSRRAPGQTCLSALKSGKHGDVGESINNSKGCGGIMRIAPVALMFNIDDYDLLDMEGARIAAITHGHSLGYMPAAMLVHIINQIVYHKGDRSLMDIIIDAKTSITRLFKDDSNLDALISIVDLAIELSTNDKCDLDNINQIGEGWVAEETLAIAIYCALRYQNDFSNGIIASVNHKGDSDSTGAITGNILGAIIGYDVIDDKWKTNLELHDTIIEISDDLCHGCKMAGDSDYWDPIWFKKYGVLDFKP